ncbi:MAG TPA: glycogen debranching enzyme N-terminal domain-containing protein, partial [Chitinophagaceae bacterium]|nr:glycogen debranching enzyme N-terminal domain-containing protein [Chitinophagaceae bacterium]
MAYELDIPTPADPDQLSQLEWIETNGTGGWASSTVCGMNTRRYHGLLVASDPLGPRRISQVARMDETLVNSEGTFEISVVDYRDALHPQGYQLLRSFRKNIFPQFTYQAGGITLKKTIAAIQGQNTTVVQYEVLEAEKPFSFRLNPFITCRDYHCLVHSNQAIRTDCSFQNDLWKVNPYVGMPTIFIRFPGFLFIPKPIWYYNIHYRQEEARGLDHMEDQFTYGWFEKELQQGDQICITLSSGEAPEKEGAMLLSQEQKRRMGLIQKGQDPTERILRLAADQFLIQDGSGSSRIIAGYHWFTSWGRDTMVSLRGLCISTGRTGLAREILLEFLKYLSEGMLPNRFPDQGEAPDYNTVDATLWFFVACHDYYRVTEDEEFLTGTLIPNLQSIMDWHEKGTRYHIHEDSDGLLWSGKDGVQLTWMDA